MRKPLLLASLAGLAIWFKRRRTNSPDAAPDQRDATAGSDTDSKRVGPPSAVGIDPLDRVVISTPAGEVTDDPAGQWADDGGSGMAGGQRQHN